MTHRPKRRISGEMQSAPPTYRISVTQKISVILMLGITRIYCLRRAGHRIFVGLWGARVL
jgi:hypothetical protein